MFEFRERKKTEYPQSYDLFLNNEIIAENVSCDENIFYTDYNVDINKIAEVKLDDFPENLTISGYVESPYKDLFEMYDLKKENNHFVVHFSSNVGLYESHKIKPYNIITLHDALFKVLNKFDELTFINRTDNMSEDEYCHLEIKYTSNKNVVSEVIQDSKIVLKKLIDNAFDFLSFVNWRNEIYDEKSFSLKIIKPLLLKMGFNDIHYTHGNNEYGKDFIMSTYNEFSSKIYYGLQIKFGKIKGGASSEIDMIINQIDDAFKMPFKNLADSNNCYINYLYVITNDFFTENAKEKILNKIFPPIQASVKFLDGDDIDILLNKYL